MGSGSSKVVIKKVATPIQVNYNAVNGLEAEDGLFKDDVNNHSKQDETKKSENKPKGKEKNDQKDDPPKPEVQQIEVQEKPYDSPTLKDTEEKLKTRGFDDQVLTQYCHETKELFEEFIKLYKYVDKIKKALEDDENFVSTTNSQYTLISSAYGNDRPQKIKKGEFLAALDFGKLCKEVYDKLIAAFPTILKYDKEKDEVSKIVRIIV